MAAPACLPTGEGSVLLIDVFLHATVVLSIIATFYFVYVSHLSENVYRDQIKSAITPMMQKLLKEVPDHALAGIDVSKLGAYYTKTPTPAHEIQNYWLRTVTIIFVAVLVLAMLLIVLLLKFGCASCVARPLKVLGIQNAAIFLFVGAMEAGFFLLIAKYYVPVMPSLLMQSALNDAKDVLDGKPVTGDSIIG